MSFWWKTTKAFGWLSSFVFAAVVLSLIAGTPTYVVRSLFVVLGTSVLLMVIVSFIDEHTS